MSLPGITLPGGFPAWLADGHEGELEDVYTRTAMRTGHARLRRIYTTVPERRRVSLLLLEHQAPRFHDWFERDLLAGERPFSTQVALVDGGLAWYAARFVDDPPYEAEPLRVAGGVGWRITATLLLYEGPQNFPPQLYALAARQVTALRGVAVGTTTKLLAAHQAIGLRGSAGRPGIVAHQVVGLEGVATATTHPALRAHQVIGLDGEVSG